MKRQHKTSGSTILESFVRVGGHCGGNRLTEVVEIAILCEFNEMINFSLPPVTHIWATLSDFITYFTQKGHKG